MKFSDRVGRHNHKSKKILVVNDTEAKEYESQNLFAKDVARSRKTVSSALKSGYKCAGFDLYML